MTHSHRLPFGSHKRENWFFNNLAVFLVILLFLVFPVVLGGADADGELLFCLDRSFKADGGEFFGPYQEMIVGPGGRIYVACNREHSILIFGANGKKLGAFGQKGRGPGDLFYPHRLSILDGKHLVVGEYATNRRVSLFDLDGNFGRLIRTDRPVFSPIALRGNKIAYLARKDAPRGKKPINVRLVIVKDINTGQEKIVRRFSIVEKGNIRLANNSVFKVGNFFGDVFLAQGPKGNLIFGNSTENILYRYNPVKNAEMPPIHINVKATRVTPQYIATFKTQYIKHLGESHLRNHPVYPVIKKKLESSSFEEFFGDHLAYYSDILTNPEGQIVLSRSADLTGNNEARALILAKDGAVQRGVKILTEGFMWSLDNKFKYFSFYTESIAFALVQDPNDEDGLYFLKKLRVSGL